jgi:ribosomal protein L25, Ctc-form
MNGTLLEAYERSEKGSKVRKEGFVPGVVYGTAMQGSKSVKFQSDKIQMYLKNNTGRKVQFKLGQTVHTGFIKEIQRESVSNMITHIDIQAAGLDDKIKMKLPVVFHGRTRLESSGLILDEYLSKVSVYGKEKDIPDEISFDVSDKKAGSVIKVSNLAAINGVKFLDEPNEVIAIINEPKRVDIEATEEAAPTTQPPTPEA